MQPADATVYTRQGCHLCDEAIQLLMRNGVQVCTIDIDTEQQFHDLYDQCVPVVWIDGKERVRGRIDERLLQRLLRAGR